MKKFIFLLLFFVLFATTGFAATKRTLHVYNWSNYIDRNVIIDFEARYKVKVVYKGYDSVEQLRELLDKLAFAEDVAEESIDVIILPDFLLQGLIEQNLLYPLQLAALKNNKYVFPSLKKQITRMAEDLGQEKTFALPYLWGTTGLAYDATALGKRLPRFNRNSWDIIFDPSLAAQFSDCGIVITDRPRQVLQIVRNYLEKDPHSTHRADLLAAEVVLRRLRPYVDIMSGFEAANALAYGDACMVLGQSTEVFLAQKDNRAVIAEMRTDKKGRRKARPRIVYNLPKQGALLWMDAMVIPIQSRQKGLAHRWINHVLSAENSLLIARATGFSSPSRQGLKLLPKAMRESNTLYPKLKGKNIIPDREPLDQNQLPSQEIRKQEFRTWERFINLRK